MVGLLVSALVVIAALGTFAASEAVKRSAYGVADAQNAGVLMAHALGTDIGNAGYGFAAALHELGTCPDTGDIRTTLRPIPVLITPGADNDAPDSLVVTYATAAAVTGAVALAAAVAPGAPLAIRSPLGIAVDDTLAAISLDGSCALTTASAVSPPDSDGVIEVAHTGLADAYPASSLVLNVGPRDRLHRVRYDIVDGTLRSLDLTTPGAAPNPLASNIVLLKAQYGVDSDNDGFLDTWVSAAAPSWTPGAVLGAPAATLAAIKTIRLGFVVRSDAWDRTVTAPYPWVLFDCEHTDKAQCPGRLTGTLPARWRYRTQEIAVPLRNHIWIARP